MIDRLVLTGQRHACHLLRRGLASAARPARHAVVFVFHQPARGVGDDGLRIATRMFLEGDDVEDLAVVLRELGNRVSDYRRAGITHPLPRIVDRAEPMSRQVRYLATASSSLVPAEDPAAPRAWRGLARLVDDTQLVVHNQVDPRTLLPDTADLNVVTSHTLDNETAPLMFGRARRWRYPSGGDDVEDPDLADAQAALDRLHGLVNESEQRSRHHHHR